MRARLIVNIKDPARVVHALYPGEVLAEGFEELEIAAEPIFRGTTLAEKHGEFDLCRCNHDRRSHDKHMWRCMARTHAQQCECIGFREKR